jgi:RNA polymerase sigma-70 factor (ECF subfamily)
MMNYDSGIRCRDGLNWAATQKARGRQREKRAVGNIGAGGQPLRPSRVIVYKDADLALVERYRTGDKAAFTELMVRYQRPIYNAAFWVLRRADDASDITQEVFLKVAERRNEYDPKFKFFSWIYRIAINESLNLLRQNRRETLDDDIDLPAPDSAGPEQQLGDAQLSERIRSAMMSMTVNDRVVLSLRHFSECSYEAIAQILDLEEKTVKSRLFESRQRLRSLLADLGSD